MLEIKDIKKYYSVGDTVTKALDGVSVSFRKQEFVAILGPSGSGKTTMLNVIGGLDNYDSGDMIINGKSTKTFKEADWDAYRNNSIGFVFQSYNLIGHLGIIENVELGMVLSGVPKAERRAKAEEVLARVGLKEHMHKKPNQLSGGQMQRVAIARALANDPEILLCDEPTGALDSETSVQIMELIKELSEEKLVIMVTHNPELADAYADRILEFSDGKILNDSNPFIEGSKTNQFQLHRTKMSFLTALRLSFNNIRNKKGRTFLTAFASSIGIISIAIVLSLSTGFQKQIDNTQTGTLSQFPVTISQVAQGKNPVNFTREEENLFPDTNEVIAKIDDADRKQHLNPMNEELIDYIQAADPAMLNGISFTRATNLNLLREIDGQAQIVKFSNASPTEKGPGSFMAMMSAQANIGTSTFPTQLGEEQNFLEENYSVLEGKFPTNKNEIVLIVDKDNSTNLNALLNLGFEVTDGEALPFSEIVGTTLKLAHNNAFYTQLPTGNFVPNQALDTVYNDENNETLTISGVLRVKDSSNIDILEPGIAYSDELTQSVIATNQDSEIVKAQKESDINVMSNEPVDEANLENLLSFLGATSIPTGVMLYPANFEAKENLLSYLDAFNQGKDADDQIIYSDFAGTMTQLTGGLMDAITYVIIAFAAISLVTSMFMIGILTYTSVLERTKEIGVLKALGARKKDITRVFDAETAILGATSGTLGVFIAFAATFPINAVLFNLTELENVAILNPIHAILLVVISTTLTILGGHIPAKMAAKKDAAIALRAE